MDVSEARKFRVLEDENARLKRLVADLSVQNQIVPRRDKWWRFLREKRWDWAWVFHFVWWIGMPLVDGFLEFLNELEGALSHLFQLFGLDFGLWLRDGCGFCRRM
jgi:hypothetical protein